MTPPLGGPRAVALCRQKDPLLDGVQQQVPFRALKEEQSVNLQRAPKDATPAVPFKLDLPQENALKSHIYRLMSRSTRIIPLLLSSGTTLLNTITHAAAAAPWEPASRRSDE